MSKVWLLLVFAITTSYAQEIRANQPAAKPLLLEAPVQDKNFYLLSAIERSAKVEKLLASDSVFLKLKEDKKASISAAAKSCGEDVACNLKPLYWSEEEIRAVQSEFVRLYREKETMRSLVDHPLQESGMYILYGGQGGAGLLAKAWNDVAHGLNHVIEVYGEGKPPLYQKIDSISFDPRSKEFGQSVHIDLLEIEKQSHTKEPFFSPSFSMAMFLLRINHRDEAGRYEPMEQGENKAAYEAIAHTDWAKYPYSAIVIPGAGPGDRETPLSAKGKERLDLAVQRYRQGKAPFLMVSGGFVHPAQTKYCEAIEMRRYLVETVGIPESAILIEPHARHTTTNLRNAIRILYRYSVPFDKPVLVTSDKDQSRYMVAPDFDNRCKKELGYLPYHSLKAVTPEDSEMISSVESLQANPMEPLDP